MTNELVSIIIPAYNSQAFISRCITSVINQTYKNLEIIVVNDGSEDRTGELVKTYKNVILLSKENGGLCSARLHGFKHSTGKYVVFIDSDDYIDKDFIYNLIKHHSGREDELVMCGFLSGEGKEDEVYSYMEMSDKNTIFAQYLRYGICNKIVNKLYPRKMIDESVFAVGRDMLEDAFFTSHVLERCNKLTRIPYAGYYYIRREGSISKGLFSYDKNEGCFSNLLEKDIVFSRHIETDDYDQLFPLISNHIKQSFRACRDIEHYDVYNKIRILLKFMNNVDYHDKAISLFVIYLHKSSSPKTMKRRFGIYTLLRDSFNNKRLYFHSIVRKVITSREKKK